MPVATTDLITYASANMPDVDTGTNGGAIDPLRRVVFTQIAANDDVEVLSSSAGDTTQTVTVTARNAGGSIVQETKTLTGTTAAIFATIGVVERILKVEMSATAAGTITLRRSVAGLTIGTIPIGERGFMALFANCAADASGGSSRDFYRKVHVKNIHGTLSGLALQIAQSADADARITHCIGAAINDTATAADRRTAPSNANLLDPDTFDDTSKPIPGTDLAAGAAVAVWYKLTLPAGDPPHRTTYDIAINCNTA